MWFRIYFYRPTNVLVSSAYSNKAEEKLKWPAKIKKG
jgi:hypothetical protein